MYTPMGGSERMVGGRYKWEQVLPPKVWVVVAQFMVDSPGTWHEKYEGRKAKGEVTPNWEVTKRIVGGLFDRWWQMHLPGKNPVDPEEYFSNCIWCALWRGEARMALKEKERDGRRGPEGYSHIMAIKKQKEYVTHGGIFYVYNPEMK